MNEQEMEQQQKILELVRSFNGPVTKEVLQWETDYSERANDYRLLGPRPRRKALYRVLGDLVDKDLVALTQEGVVIQEISDGER
jgi:hypothetical protein